MGPRQEIAERIVSRPVLCSIVGKKGAGKSEILERLIVLLTQRKFRVGVIKQLARDDFEIDEPGKDTYRYRTQGAGTVILSGRKRLAIFSNIQEEMPLNRLLTFFEDFNLVFLEGYSIEGIPKIEVQNKEMNLDQIIPWIEEKLAQSFPLPQSS